MSETGSAEQDDGMCCDGPDCHCFCDGCGEYLEQCECDDWPPDPMYCTCMCGCGARVQYRGKCGMCYEACFCGEHVE